MLPGRGGADGGRIAPPLVGIKGFLNEVIGDDLAA